MHHLSLHITTTQNSEKIFSSVIRLLHKNVFGVIFWMTAEENKIEFGLVVRKETKQQVKEEISFYLNQNGINDFGYSQPLKPEVNKYWLELYMPKEYKKRFA